MGTEEPSTGAASHHVAGVQPPPHPRDKVLMPCEPPLNGLGEGYISCAPPAWYPCP